REVVEEYSRNNNVNIGFKYRAYYPPSRILNPDHPLVKIIQDSIREVLNINVPAVGEQGSSDISFISALGIPVVSIGVSREESNAHGVDENINIEDLNALTKILARCYIKLLGTV
ncbi:MAG: M20/M25/M40 family metallo-hydrolase, partial [Candidatus Methanomethylicia archaeon]